MRKSTCLGAICVLCGVVYGMIGGFPQPENPPGTKPPIEPSIVKGFVQGPGGRLEDSEGIITITNEEGDWSEDKPLGPDGRFEFVDIEAGIYLLTVKVEGFGERSRKFEVKPGKKQIVNMTVGPWITIEGIVYDTQGDPLPDTKLHQHCIYQWQNTFRGKTFNAATDSEGRYRLDIEKDLGLDFRVVVYNLQDGYAISPWQVREAVKNHWELDLYLKPGFTLTGIVRDAETHQPIPDLGLNLERYAFLVDVPGSISQLSANLPPVPPQTLAANREPRNAATTLPWGQGNVARTKTDENGAFTFQHLLPGIYLVGPIDMRWDTYRGWKHVAVIGEREDVPVSIEWELYKKDWPVYTVHVLDPDGLPLANTLVPFGVGCECFGSGSRSKSEGTTDDEGRLQVPLIKGYGQYLIDIMVPGYRRVRTDFLYMGHPLEPSPEIFLQEE